MKKYQLKEYVRLWLVSVILMCLPFHLYAHSHQALKHLAAAESNPLNVNSTALNTDSVSSKPADSKPTVEQEIADLKGTFEIRVVLTKDEPIQYLLIDDKAKTYYLHFDTVPNELATGTQIIIKRAVKTNAVGTALQPADESHLLVKSTDIVVVQTAAAGVAPGIAIGPQKVLVMLINFQDKKNPTTLTQVSQMIFKTVSDNYYESSYHQTTLVGKSVGPGTAPVSSTQDCNTITSQVQAYGVAMAKRAGIHPENYPHHLFLIPNTNKCSWAGLSTLGGNPSKSWSNGYNTIYVMAHELGHGLGLWHSNYIECPNSPIDGTCKHIEYGDNADTMGAELNGGHFNAFQKERLGWLNYNSSSVVQTVTTTGTYPIYPYENYDSNIKVLKVLKKNLADGSKDYYYIEFRQPIGYDKGLGSCRNCDFSKGILFHTGNTKNTNTSYILDMTPSVNNQMQTALFPGKQFADVNTPVGKVTFTLQSVTNGVAYVNISFPVK